MSTEHEVPTMEQVGEWEQRLRRDEGRLRWIEGRETELRGGLASLRASGREDAPEATTLRDELRELRLERQEISDTLPVLRKRIKSGRESAFRAQAEARLVGIKKASHSLADQYKKDGRRVGHAAAHFAESVQRMNARYHNLLSYRAEAAALALRFGLSVPELPTPLAPASSEDVIGALRVAQGAAPARSALHRIGHEGPPPESPGARLIDEAGASDAQRASEAEAERQKRERERAEQEAMAPFQGHLERAAGTAHARGFRQ